ncbi:hypothetical protein DY000_02023780 [Brassica cretica]|uniref:Uncharacterized protein n=1 Tax=Brassica cretica TaxID=69181 RepID=A0ABQ7E5K9_BRACR|nr:hypothetical protein DY000_02023780 [Brassica cretica]
MVDGREQSPASLDEKSGNEGVLVYSVKSHSCMREEESAGEEGLKLSNRSLTSRFKEEMMESAD